MSKMLKNLPENVFPLNHGGENNFICINIYCEIISLTGNKKEEGRTPYKITGQYRASGKQVRRVNLLQQRRSHNCVRCWAL